MEGVERIRYTSPHPKDMREDVIRAHAELPALCEHIHLPLQSGSSRILKAMRRTYNRERYLDRVAMIREHVPDCSITTDIIVGFPGETDEDFEQTLEVVEETRYDGAFTFIYSPRRGTEAAELPDQVPHERASASAWSGWWTSSSGSSSSARSASWAARWRCWSRARRARIPDKLRGRTRHNKTVNFPGLAQPGELAQVEITGATSTTLAGEELLLSRALA